MQVEKGMQLKAPKIGRLSLLEQATKERLAKQLEPVHWVDISADSLNNSIETERERVVHLKESDIQSPIEIRHTNTNMEENFNNFSQQKTYLKQLTKKITASN